VFSQEIARGAGAWLKVNGEAIYGTMAGPLQDLPFGRTTSKRKDIYLHVFDWPKGALEVPGLRARVRQVTCWPAAKRSSSPNGVSGSASRCRSRCRTRTQRWWLFGRGEGFGRFSGATANSSRAQL